MCSPGQLPTPQQKSTHPRTFRQHKVALIEKRDTGWGGREDLEGVEGRSGNEQNALYKILKELIEVHKNETSYNQLSGWLNKMVSLQFYKPIVWNQSHGVKSNTGPVSPADAGEESLLQKAARISWLLAPSLNTATELLVSFPIFFVVSLSWLLYVLLFNRTHDETMALCMIQNYLFNWSTLSWACIESHCHVMWHIDMLCGVVHDYLGRQNLSLSGGPASSKAGINGNPQSQLLLWLLYLRG